MKIVSPFVVLLVLLSCCTPNHYVLSDKNKDKYYLAHYIKAAAKKGEISKHPLVFVNAIPFTYDMLKDKKLHVSKNSIKEIRKLSDEELTARYGSLPKNGALQIITQLSFTLARNGHSLILLDDKKISMEELDKLDTNEIQSISVFKGIEQVKKFTSENYDSVIVLRVKKS
ncbi:MAG TPA: hypothetical protein VL728_07995 [Cyclobacteriaceae bacterium]|jgi:hypothetical protein|nr:hypothetical protein [Cyclobacteriaceae bacterium]